MNDILNNDLSREFREKLELYEKSNVYKTIGELFITNAYGANVAQSGITSDYRQDDEDWCQFAKKNELYINKIEFDESADMQSIFLR